MKLSKKLFTVIMPLALLPLMITSMVAWLISNQLTERQLDSFAFYAQGLQDVIDRNLFERYGDVQAFTKNQACHIDLTAATDEQKTALTKTINEYIKTYGCYDLSLVTDVEGNIIAVNTIAADGTELATAELVGQSVAGQVWFEKTKAGDYTTGDGLATGTYMRQPHRNDYVSNAYGEKAPAFNLGFSAPILVDGEVKGYWQNLFSSRALNDIALATYNKLKASMGWGQTEVTIINSDGIVLVDVDPTLHGPQGNTDPNVILALDLSQVELVAAAKSGTQQTGIAESVHKRKQIGQFGGYARSEPVLGWAGTGFISLIRTPADEVANTTSFFRTITISVFVFCLVATFLTIWYLQRITAKPLSIAINSLNDNVHEIRRASNDLAGHTQQAANNATTQSCNLQESSSALEELTASVKQNADNAVEATALAKEANNRANHGQNQSQAAVDEFNVQMKTMQDAVEAIKDSTVKTAKVVDTIDEIAFQTNLLALNAAVEAARAGEAGAGFAVVAEEVRNLAQRCASEVRNTSQLIDEAKKNAAQIEKVNSDVGEFLHRTLASEIVDIFDKTTEATTKAMQLMEEVSAASSEQSRGIEQINTAVYDLDGLTQRNATAVDQAAGTISQLNQRLELIHQLGSDLRLQILGQRNHSLTSTRPQAAAAAATAGAGAAAAKSRRSTEGLPQEAKAIQDSPKAPSTERVEKAVSPDEVLPLDDDDDELSDF